MLLELFVGLPDHTWQLAELEIPEQATKEEVQQRVDLFSDALAQNVGDISFVGIYNIRNKE